MGLPLILDQMIYLKQIYTKTPNLVDNITKLLTYHNGLILLHSFLTEIHFHFVYFQLSFFKCFQIISFF